MMIAIRGDYFTDNHERRLIYALRGDLTELGEPRYGKRMWAKKLREWNYRCAKCGKSFAPKDLTQGHLIPRSRGGERHAGNLVPLCHHCNQEDGNILASYEEMDMTTTMRLEPDGGTKALLSRHSAARDEPIHGQVSYLNIPLNKRVRIVEEEETGVFGGKTGRIHSANLSDDRYWITLDDPIVHEHGITREVDTVEVNKAAIVFLDS